MKKTRIATIATAATLSAALFAWGAISRPDDVMGVVTRADQASLTVAAQPDGDRVVTITRVVAPADAFVVVHQNDGGMPGKLLGYASIQKGVSNNVVVKLDKETPLTPELLAAVHIDLGREGVLEFDPENIERSSDRPFFVDGKELAVTFKGADFGIPAGMDEAAIEAADQPSGKSVTVAKASAPTPAFVVIHRAKPDGMPGERVGFSAIKSGENLNVEVKLDQKIEKTTKLLAAVHVDADNDGKLEFDMNDPVASPDQPFFAGGMEVATAFTVGPFGVNVRKASIETTDQIGAEKTLVIEKVDAPSGAWVVVHKSAGGAPGDRVGIQFVEPGVARNVKVTLDEGMLPEQLIVALHADRGDSEVFDFDMNDKLGSPDQPFFVGGEEVAKVVTVRAFGYPTPTGTAGVSAQDQVVTDARLLVAEAQSPEAAWIVVHLDAGGMPGARVGLAHIPAGITRNAIIQLDATKELSDVLFVAVHADRGDVGMFEFNMMDRVNSADQPFFVDGAEVATGVTIR